MFCINLYCIYLTRSPFDKQRSNHFSFTVMSQPLCSWYVPSGNITSCFKRLRGFCHGWLTKLWQNCPIILMPHSYLTFSKVLSVHPWPFLVSCAILFLPHLLHSKIIFLIPDSFLSMPARPSNPLCFLTSLFFKFCDSFQFFQIFTRSHHPSFHPLSSANTIRYLASLFPHHIHWAQTESGSIQSFFLCFCTSGLQLLEKNTFNISYRSYKLIAYLLRKY